MKIPKYWAQSAQVAKAPGGRAFKLVAWQWSDDSLEQARQKAAARIQELVLKVSSGAQLNRYSYGERALREEITQSVTTSNGNEIGVVTRNRYGALVLNAADAMFIDIDFDEKGAGAALAGQLQRMLGARSPNPEDQSVQRITQWASQYPDLGIRIYRTFAGLRCLITNQVFDPARTETADLLRSLGTDPLYLRLCQAQGCFRARLTPKPWRCGIAAPRSTYPYENPAAETRFRQWQQRYEQAIRQYSVCKFIKQLGPAEAHPDVQPILKLHDQSTAVVSEFKLA